MKKEKWEKTAKWFLFSSGLFLFSIAYQFLNFEIAEPQKTISLFWLIIYGLYSIAVSLDILS